MKQKGQSGGLDAREDAHRETEVRQGVKNSKRLYTCSSCLETPKQDGLTVVSSLLPCQLLHSPHVAVCCCCVQLTTAVISVFGVGAAVGVVGGGWVGQQLYNRK